MSRDAKNQTREPLAYRKRREANARRQREFRKRHPGYNDKYVRAYRAKEKTRKQPAKQPATYARRLLSRVNGTLRLISKRVPPVTSPAWRVIVHVLLAYVMAVVASKTVG